MRNEIREASNDDLKDFLESIRKVSAKTGEVALNHVRMSASTTELYVRALQAAENMDIGAVSARRMRRLRLQSSVEKKPGVTIDEDEALNERRSSSHSTLALVVGGERCGQARFGSGLSVLSHLLGSCKCVECVC